MGGEGGEEGERGQGGGLMDILLDIGVRLRKPLTCVLWSSRKGCALKRPRLVGVWRVKERGVWGVGSQSYIYKMSMGRMEREGGGV